jgi:hypothetical protein
MLMSHTFTIVIVSFLVVAPLLLWLALYAAARWWSVNLRPTLRYLRAVRWVGWSFGIILFLVHWIRDDFSASYGIALLTFAVGLAMPESWVKKHFAPDLLEESQPEEYWPRKPE